MHKFSVCFACINLEDLCWFVGIGWYADVYPCDVMSAVPEVGVRQGIMLPVLMDGDITTCLDFPITGTNHNIIKMPVCGLD